MIWAPVSFVLLSSIFFSVAAFSLGWREKLKCRLLSLASSDEILLSSDKTVAIIDGSGVAADPAGLDRQELIRLAKARLPIGNFDRSKFSKDGYLVKVEEHDVKLPCKSLTLVSLDDI